MQRLVNCYGSIRLERIKKLKMHSVPVIAYGRGDIPSMMSHAGGKVIDVSMAFDVEAALCINGWKAMGSDYDGIRDAAYLRFCALRTGALSKLKQISDAI